MSNPEDLVLKPKTVKNADLSAYNTLGVEATADILINIREVDDIFYLIKQGFFENSKPIILGEGSNILFKKDISDPILKMSISGIKTLEENKESVIVEAGAGENWHRFVSWAVEKDLGGIENLALIPGTVGAAPIQNIGAYGVELSSIVEFVEFVDISSGKLIRYSPEECKFGYRDSIFKRDLKEQAIVTKLGVRLTKSNHNIKDHYKSLNSYLQEKSIITPSIKDIYDAVISIRTSKLPDPKLLGNAGSFFKNPIVDIKTAKKLHSAYKNVPVYPVDDQHKKIPAGWLIEMAGWKGKKVGNVGTYENQALVIVNHGGATGEDIYEHAMKIRASVKKKFAIELAPEVNILG